MLDETISPNIISTKNFKHLSKNLKFYFALFKFRIRSLFHKRKTSLILEFSIPLFCFSAHLLSPAIGFSAKYYQTSAVYRICSLFIQILSCPPSYCKKILYCQQIWIPIFLHSDIHFLNFYDRLIDETIVS